MSMKESYTCSLRFIRVIVSVGFASMKNKIAPTVGYRRWFFRLHPRCRVVHLLNKQNVKETCPLNLPESNFIFSQSGDSR